MKPSHLAYIYCRTIVRDTLRIKIQQFIAMPDSLHIESTGFCRTCDRKHRLGVGNAPKAAKELMSALEKTNSISLFSDHAMENKNLSTRPLFGQERGKMFGVMECCRKDGRSMFCYAFSGQYSGSWLVPGWVPPVFSVDAFNRLNVPQEKEIKKLSGQIEQQARHSPARIQLQKQRRLLSRELMQNIHRLYHLSNFRGDTAPMQEVFVSRKGMPTGTGDCCAPKLLQFAAHNGLRPLGLCEFFWGKETKSYSYRHREFSAPCQEKCSQILGFMLCGLEK